MQQIESISLLQKEKKKKQQDPRFPVEPSSCYLWSH